MIWHNSVWWENKQAATVCRNIYKDHPISINKTNGHCSESVHHFCRFTYSKHTNDQESVGECNYMTRHCNVFVIANNFDNFSEMSENKILLWMNRFDWFLVTLIILENSRKFILWVHQVGMAPTLSRMIFIIIVRLIKINIVVSNKNVPKTTCQWPHLIDILLMFCYT